MNWFSNLFKRNIDCRGGGCTALIDVVFCNPKGKPEIQILRCPICMTLNLTGHDIDENIQEILVKKVRLLEEMDKAYLEENGEFYPDEELKDAWKSILKF